jgi:hypothetical protein
VHARQALPADVDRLPVAVHAFDLMGLLGIDGPLRGLSGTQGFEHLDRLRHALEPPESVRVQATLRRARQRHGADQGLATPTQGLQPHRDRQHRAVHLERHRPECDVVAGVFAQRDRPRRPPRRGRTAACPSGPGLRGRRPQSAARGPMASNKATMPSVRPISRPAMHADEFTCRAVVAGPQDRCVRHRAGKLRAVDDIGGDDDLRCGLSHRPPCAGAGPGRPVSGNYASAA